MDKPKRAPPFSLRVVKNGSNIFFSLALRAVIFILLLNVINPDARIVEYNLNQNKNLDGYYLSQLSADAFRVIYSGRDKLPDDKGCDVRKKMMSNLTSNTDWQDWNWSLNKIDKINHYPFDHRFYWA